MTSTVPPGREPLRIATQALRACTCLAPAIWPEGPAPKGQESLAQGLPGLPWVSGNKRFALKGLEGQAIRSRGLELIPGADMVAPSGLIRVGGITQGKPRVNPGLSYFGHFGPRIERLRPKDRR